MKIKTFMVMGSQEAPFDGSYCSKLIKGEEIDEIINRFIEDSHVTLVDVKIKVMCIGTGEKFNDNMLIYTVFYKEK